MPRDETGFAWENQMREKKKVKLQVLSLQTNAVVRQRRRRKKDEKRRRELNVPAYSLTVPLSPLFSLFAVYSFFFILLLSLMFSFLSLGSRRHVHTGQVQTSRTETDLHRQNCRRRCATSRTNKVLRSDTRHTALTCKADHMG